MMNDEFYTSPEQHKLDSCSYWMESILTRLYNKDEVLDISALEWDLDELSHLLDVRMPRGQIKIEPRVKTAVAAYSEEFLRSVCGE
jgi:hypothetical protein